MVKKVLQIFVLYINIFWQKETMYIEEYLVTLKQTHKLKKKKLTKNSVCCRIYIKPWVFVEIRKYAIL